MSQVIPRVNAAGGCSASRVQSEAPRRFRVHRLPRPPLPRRPTPRTTKAGTKIDQNPERGRSALPTVPMPRSIQPVEAGSDPVRSSVQRANRPVRTTDAPHMRNQSASPRSKSPSTASTNPSWAISRKARRYFASPAAVCSTPTAVSASPAVRCGKRIMGALLSPSTSEFSRICSRDRPTSQAPTSLGIPGYRVSCNPLEGSLPGGLVSLPAPSPRDFAAKLPNSSSPAPSSFLPWSAVAGPSRRGLAEAVHLTKLAGYLSARVRPPATSWPSPIHRLIEFAQPRDGMRLVRVSHVANSLYPPVRDL